MNSKPYTPKQVLHVTKQRSIHAGCCNFCKDRAHEFVYEFTGDGSGLQVRICGKCFSELKTKINSLREPPARGYGND